MPLVQTLVCVWGGGEGHRWGGGGVVWTLSQHSRTHRCSERREAVNTPCPGSGVSFWTLSRHSLTHPYSAGTQADNSRCADTESRSLDSPLPDKSGSVAGRDPKHGGSSQYCFIGTFSLESLFYIIECWEGTKQNPNGDKCRILPNPCCCFVMLSDGNCSASVADICHNSYRYYPGHAMYTLNGVLARPCYENIGM